MPCNYFFYEGLLDLGLQIVFEGEEFHHLKDVMRAVEGETITLVDGKGKMASVLLERIDKRKAFLQVESVEEFPEKKTKLVLGISLLRPGHLDFVIEKGTEIGVDTFLVFPACLSERKEVSQSLLRRLRAICIAALKQSGRHLLPEIVIVSSLEEALNISSRPIVWAEKCPEAKFLDSALSAEKERKTISIFIGPESGWSKEEKILLHQYGPPICLHDTILRAETAGILGAYVGYTWLQ